jgi:hypothetical protein
VYGSALKITLTWPIRPSSERSGSGLADATAASRDTRVATSSRSAGWTGPSSLTTRTVDGSVAPDGNERESTLKPSTLSVFSLNAFSVE